MLLDGQDMTALRPCERPINTVFQDYALFPHMNVSQNIAFGLSLRGVGSAETRRKVMEVLELVGLPDKAQARVGSLSGGQKQRVALARAWCASPACCCWMNRSPPSMPACANTCRPNSSACRKNWHNLCHGHT